MKTMNSTIGAVGTTVLSWSRRQLLFGILFLTVLLGLNLSDATAQKSSKGKVLIVLTTTKSLELKDGKSYDTPGYYLDELSYPLKNVVDAGYEPVFATIDGATPYIDPASKAAFFFNNDEQAAKDAVAYVEKFDGLRHPLKLSAIVGHTSGYAGILVPGGFGPMQDLVTDADLGKILLSFHQAGKPTGLICHGPVTLISTLPQAKAFKAAIVAGDYAKATKLAQGWPYAGYRLTVFSPGEELLTHQLGGEMTYFVSHALSQAGAHVDFLAQGQSNVIEDREVVTGQQPFSSEAFGIAFVKKLQKQLSRKS